MTDHLEHSCAQSMLIEHIFLGDLRCESRYRSSPAHIDQVSRPLMILTADSACPLLWGLQENLNYKFHSSANCLLMSLTGLGQ